MAKKAYDWKNGPAEIQQHSIVKHHLLQAYLADYFQTLATAPGQEELRITLVDGFAGGGQYIHENSRDIVPGSPLICLNAVREAEFRLNENRDKPLRINADYFFIESDRHAFNHLDKVLRNEGHGAAIGNTIHPRHATFQDQAATIIQAVQKKSPRNGRSIFILDQYGYKNAPSALIKSIFAALPSAEVILTFGVDSFINFAGDNGLSQQLLDQIGIPDLLKGRTWDDIKNSDRDWRLWVQTQLYRELVTGSGAEYYTPFFIRNTRGHGDYWLIHLSQHHRARDVMTALHWKHQNHFIHYAGAGLDMFHGVGYNPDHDAAFKRQFELGFEFDDVARASSVAALMDQIPRRIYAHDAGMTFGELFATTCNESPASAAIYRDAIERLRQEKALEIVSADGSRRLSANTIRSSDQLTAPAQQSLFLPGVRP